MTTVPRPERANEPTEADHFRALLAAIGDALDTPLDAGDTMAERDRVTAERAIIVKVMARCAADWADPEYALKWMQEELAKAKGGAQ